MFEDFVEDWLIYNTVLGEGAYGEVKLVMNRKTKEKVACKIIDIQKYKTCASTQIKREMTIHNMLQHNNIIRYYGIREEHQKVYLFMEYAAGGELFQQIEPGIGMPHKEAQSFMRQLIDAVTYLHSKGITHRDIKPENILLSDTGVLKLTDFGLATIFRLKNKERLLEKRCGTKPYLAPEILSGPYKAEPADTWSCGCVLVAMLVGELLWTVPTNECIEFVRYKEDRYLSQSPWCRLGNHALSFVKQLVTLDPKKRITLDRARNHPWMKLNFDKDSSVASIDTNDGKSLRWSSIVETEDRETPYVTLSQPVLSRPVDPTELLRQDVCFSQPIHNEDLLLSSQVQFTQTQITKDNFHHLIKRMTRFFINSSREKAVEVICSVLDSLHYSWTIDAAGAIAISTVDNMKNQLLFKANPIEMEGRILVDFRLGKGCGIEFKKKFKKVKDCLGAIVEN